MPVDNLCWCDFFQELLRAYFYHALVDILTVSFNLPFRMFTILFTADKHLNSCLVWKDWTVKRTTPRYIGFGYPSWDWRKQPNTCALVMLVGVSNVLVSHLLARSFRSDWSTFLLKLWQCVKFIIFSACFKFRQFQLTCLLCNKNQESWLKQNCHDRNAAQNSSGIV